MKLFWKCILLALAIFVLVIVGFLLFRSVVDQRSFMAELTDVVLIVQRRSDKFKYLDVCEAYIEGKAEANALPVEIKTAKFGVSLREERDGPLQAFIYNDRETPAQTVFYFPGGAYLNEPNAQQTTMAARCAKETGSEVVLMVYPRAPVYDCADAYQACISFIQSYVEENSCGKIVFMGDSAGGGLALGMAEELRNRGIGGPEELILISPWVDVTMSNEDMTTFQENDPMLGIDGMRRIGEVWADELSPEDPRVSPLYGDVSGLGRVTLTAGTWEVFYPDILLLAQKLKDAGTDCDLIVGERMIHCYPICPIPEAKEAQAAIWAAITR